MLFILIVFFSPTKVFAVAIQDPIQHFYDNFEIFKDDKVLIYKVDLNEDGRDEIFISTNSPRRNNAKAGIIWELYISKDNGYVHYRETSKIGVAFIAPEAPVRLHNGRLAITHYHASNARSGSLFAYYLDGDNVVKKQKLGEINAEPGEYREKSNNIIKTETVTDQNQTGSSEYKIFSLQDIYSDSQVKKLKSYQDDFWATHSFRNDPDTPGKRLVYRKLDGEFVGYLVRGKFEPTQKGDERKSLGAKDPTVSNFQTDKKQPLTQTGKKQSISNSGFVLLMFIIGVVLIRVIFIIAKRRKKSG